MADTVWSHVNHTNSKRVLVGISGICGSGKSSVAERLQATLVDRGISTMIVPMDGYHYPKSHLAAMENPDTAFQRRGAHWTFDAEAFCSLIGSLRKCESATFANGWSHSLGDPVVNGIRIEPTVKVVLIEGLYLCLNLEPWKRLDFDLIVWVDLPLDTAMKRLAKRHIETGLSSNLQDAEKRIQENDLLNANFVLANRREDIVDIAFSNQ